MSSHRKNTLVVDFSVLPKRLEPAKLMQFLEKTLQLDKADVKNIQLHNLKKCAFIEMNDFSTATRLYKQHNYQHSLECDGTHYKIPVFVESSAINVRIHDLPPQMPNVVIFDHMQQYGKVVSVYNEVWKHYFSGVPNGVRVVRMRMDKPVPSCIVINNESTTVSYPNQTKLRETERRRDQTSTSNSTAEAVNNNDNGSVSISVQRHTSKEFDDRVDDENDDNDDEKQHNDDDDNDSSDNNVRESTSKTKRRLSTGTSSGTNEEDSTQLRSQSCQRSGKTPNEKKFREDNIPDSGWKVYNTRSRKKM